MSRHAVEELQVGMRIAHGIFGEGVITKLNVSSDSTMEVDFQSVGHKKLMLRFASFKILD